MSHGRIINKIKATEEEKPKQITKECSFKDEEEATTELKAKIEIIDNYVDEILNKDIANKP